MGVKPITICFGLIYLGVLLPKTLRGQNYDAPTDISDNIPKLLFSSSAKPTEQNDNVLTLQSKTNMMQKTASSQITSRNAEESQSNMIGSTTFNKDPLTGETIKEETIKEETINKERSFTRAALPLKGNPEKNKILVYNNDNFTTEGDNELNQSLLSTENQNLITNKLSSVHPSTTKAVEKKPFMLHVTNATETSISVSWNATENMNQFIVSIADLNGNNYDDIVVNTTSVTIPNLKCSGCRYNISVKSVYGKQTFSQSVSTTNYTVPMMPKVEVDEQSASVMIKISKDSQDCKTLENDQKWEINEGSSTENCIIEKDDLKKHVNYNLTIWRRVDVWKSKNKIITFHLKTGSLYTVDVYATNSVGMSPRKTISFTTPPGIPDAVNIFIHDTTAVNVTISLSRPHNFKGDIIGYVIEIYKGDKRSNNNNKLKTYDIICHNCSQTYASSSIRCPCSKPCQEKFIYSLTEHFSLNELTPYTNYSISAQAYTSAGCGKKTEKIITTQESAPSKVQNLTIFTLQTKARMEWKEPKCPNGIIQYYSIRLFYNKSCSLSRNNTEKKFMLEGLKPYQKYEVEIVAMNSMPGEICKQEFMTKIGEPEPVKLSIVSKTSKSITIEWISLHPNGPIENYSVSWEDVKENISNSKSVFMNTNYTITNLEPYRTYMIKVKICNTNYCCDSSQVSCRTEIGVPYTVRNASAKAESATSIRVHWQEPIQFTGPTEYIIQGESLTTLNTANILQPVLGPFTVSGFHNTSILIEDLQEYWPYKFNITTNTTAGKGAPVETLRTLTEESTPGPVESLDIYVNYSCYIALLVTWKKPLPEDENGIILKYEITYWSDNNGKKKICVNATLFSTMMIAFGEHSYTIQIRAETSKGLGNPRNKTVYVEPQIPIPPKQVIIKQSNAEVDDSSRQIAINMPNEFFTDFTFGRPVKWGLIVAQSEAVKFSDQRHIGIHLENLEQWKDVYDTEITQPYRPTPTDWKPPYILGQDKDVYILGSKEDCEDTPTYCNGYLKPNTNYRVKAFMCTNGGCSATKYSKSMHTDKDSTAIYITVPVLLVAAAVAMNIVFIMWHKKLYCFKKKQITTVSSLVDANQNGNVNHSFTIKNAENSRPIMLAHFHSKVEMMKRDSNLQFCEEFKLLKSLSPVQPHVAAELQANRTKNRYTNILAYDCSRVKLLPLDDEEGSDYINANYIPGFSLLREYIASQGPLHSTKDDFWRMIWEQSVSIVVMVTLTVERGRVKCEDYWPKGTEPVYFGDLVVQLKSESNLSDYVIRIMDVNMGESTREVKQFHFLKWPDFGCPQNTSLLINFVQTVRTHMPYKHTGPTLVHCSAGVGRTGTFIVIDRLLQHIQINYDVDIFGLIFELRKYRPNMVQTEDQYRYIFQCIADHLKQMEKVDAQDIYINETGM